MRAEWKNKSSRGGVGAETSFSRETRENGGGFQRKGKRQLGYRITGTLAPPFRAAF